MQTKRELLTEIKILEEKILLQIENLGLQSTYERKSNRKTVKSNKTMAAIIDELNRGFYDYTTKTIKEKLSFYNKSLYTVMDIKHLQYRKKSLETIYYHIISPNFDKHSEVKDQLITYAYLTGIRERENFKKENKTIPFTHLQKINPINTIKTIFMDRLNRFKEDKDVDEKKLQEAILYLSKLLQIDLPKHFKEEKAYGKAIGKLTESFYGLTSKELVTVFRNYNIKISNPNIIYLMNKKHLVYRYVSLLLIKKYMEMYNENEYDIFIEKCDMIGYISKMVFRETYGKTPYQELLEINKSKISNLRVSKNLKNNPYNLLTDIPVEIGKQLPFEQPSISQQKRTRTRK